MATTTARRAPLVPSSPLPNPRMCLVASRAGRAVLDGGWWPRSTDPFAELPGLVLALGTRFGVVRQLMLSSATWDSRPRRLAVGAQVIRLGWFVSVDPALAIAITAGGDQLDLLVVPVGTAEAVAWAAMARAADPANTTRASAIMAEAAGPAGSPAVAVTPAALAASAGPAGRAGQDDDPGLAWENEGGRPVEDHSSQVAARVREAVTGRGTRV